MPAHRKIRMSSTTNLRRFSIADLGALTLLVAICLVATAPWIRSASIEQVKRIKIASGIAFPSLVAGVLWAIFHRQRLLEKAGSSIAQLHTGTTRWKYWPTIRACFAVSAVAAIATCQFALFVFVSNYPSFFSHLYLAVATAAVGGVFCRFAWRLRPGDIEFFERGVVLHGRLLIGWDRIELKSSRFFENRLVLVAGQGTAATTLLFSTDPASRQQILAAAAAGGSTLAPDSQDACGES